MKKENKLIIGEILLLVEKNLDTFLDKIDVSDKAYLEAKQDFNKIKTKG